MKHLSEILVCPKCHWRLSYTVTGINCSLCNLSYPIYKGVPDFRTANPEFRPSDKENVLRDALLSEYDTSTFEELIEIRYSYSQNCPKKISDHQKTFELSFEQKGSFRRFQINTLLEHHKKTSIGNELLLDLGCGSGTSIASMMAGFHRAIGVDYSLPDLIVGSKFMRERKIRDLMLVCADVRQLPLPHSIIDFANATDVIEHIIPGQDKFLKEVRRVLKEDAAFYFNSPNRYNLFTPEPHVKLRFVGFFPRALMNRYVKTCRGVAYNSVRLLSLSELKLYLKNNFDNRFFISGPFINPDSASSDWKRIMIKRWPFILTIINQVFFFFTTNYQVLAFKK